MCIHTYAQDLSETPKHGRSAIRQPYHPAKRSVQTWGYRGQRRSQCSSFHGLLFLVDTLIHCERRIPRQNSTVIGGDAASVGLRATTWAIDRKSFALDHGNPICYFPQMRNQPRLRVLQAMGSVSCMNTARYPRLPENAWKDLPAMDIFHW